MAWCTGFAPLGGVYPDPAALPSLTHPGMEMLSKTLCNDISLAWGRSWEQLRPVILWVSTEVPEDVGLPESRASLNLVLKVYAFHITWSLNARQPPHCKLSQSHSICSHANGNTGWWDIMRDSWSVSKKVPLEEGVKATRTMHPFSSCTDSGE